MNFCDYAIWLHLSNRNQYYLHYIDRISRVNWKMTCFSSFQSFVICFVDSKNKNIAFRKLFSYNNIKRSRQTSLVNVHLNFSFSSTEWLLFIFNIDVSSTISFRLSENLCHESEVTNVSWQFSINSSIVDYIYARLLFLFNDVICIFADDFEELKNVAQHLVIWIKIDTTFTLFDKVRSRIVIVASNDTDAMIHSFLKLESLRFSLDQICWNEVFASIILIQLASSQMFALTRHRRFKKILLFESNLIRIVQIEKRVLFSTKHFESFFQKAVQHTIKIIDRAFDFIANIKLYKMFENDYENHIYRFLQIDFHYYISTINLIEFVIFSIMMNAYSSRMHDMFCDALSWRI